MGWASRSPAADRRPPDWTVRPPADCRRPKFPGYSGFRRTRARISFALDANRCASSHRGSRAFSQRFGGHMKKIITSFVAALVLCAASAFAQSERKDLQVFNDISTAVNRYAFFTIFDDVSANMESGTVTLTGKVTQPYKRDEIEKRVAKIAGV